MAHTKKTSLKRQPHESFDPLFYSSICQPHPGVWFTGQNIYNLQGAEEKKLRDFFPGAMLFTVHRRVRLCEFSLRTVQSDSELFFL